MGLNNPLINEIKSGTYLSGDTLDLFGGVLRAKSRFSPLSIYVMGGLESIEPIPSDSKHIQIMSLDMYSEIDNAVSHWVCTYFDSTVVHVYDSLNLNNLTERQKQFLEALYPHNPPVVFEPVQQQTNGIDCGVFAAAFATSIACGRDPRNEVYNIRKMRDHLAMMIMQCTLQPFPLMSQLEPVPQNGEKKKGRPIKIKRGRPKTSALTKEEQIKIAVRKYTQEHPEVHRDFVKRYSQKHPEVHRDAVKRYSQKHPEVHRGAVKRYSQEHPGVEKEKKKKYEKINRSVRMESQKLRRTVLEELRQTPQLIIPSTRKSTCIADKFGIELDSVKALCLKQISLRSSKECPHCHAPLFLEESSRKMWCCGGGALKFKLSPLNAQFYKNNAFLKDARRYNNMFAFSALGTTHGFKTPAAGTAFLKVQGKIYHRVFDLAYDRSTNNTALYIDDGEARLRTAEGTLNPIIINSIQKYLEEVNPLINDLRILSRHPSEEAHIVFQVTNRRRDGPILGDMPISREISGLLRTDFQSNPRQVVVWRIGQKKPHNVHYLSSAYEPLQYPLIFPTATAGWSLDLKDQNNKKVSQIKYYRYMWLSEPRFIQLKRLSQEYIIDMWCRAEEERLQFFKHNQSTILRVATRREIDETIAAGVEVPPGKIYLPATHTHSPRYMLEKYLDSMAVVSRLGKPSFFLTVTCNPNWNEIRESLLPGQTATDRPDLCVRVFQLKLASLLNLIKSGKLFGTLVSIQHVIEFQKRGLPHAHIAFRVIGGGPVSNIDIDTFVRATIPPAEEAGGRLRELVRQNMVHGPCGIDNLNCPCMDKEKKICTKQFPKPFMEVTSTDDKGFVNYKRPRTDDTLLLSNGKTVNNQWIVPYCPPVLLLMECHCNLEIATSSRVIKYLYKYLHKGPDHAHASVTENINAHDEIENYTNFRYISSSEALWRTFEYDLCCCYPSVVALPIHLPLENSVIFRPGDELNAAARSSSKLIIYFGRPKTSEFKNLSYLDFYEQYNVETKKRTNALVPVIDHSDGQHYITKRQRGNCVARMHYIFPNAGERYFLRMLINRISCYGYEDIRTVDGILYNTFQEAANAHGLIDNDREYKDTLREASAFKTGPQLRQLFLIIITTGGPAKILWEEFKDILCEDLLLRFPFDVAYNKGLCDINRMLRSHGRSLSGMGLPEIVDDSTELGREKLRWSISDCEAFVRQWEPLLNAEQLNLYINIVRVVKSPPTNGRAIFIDGPAGTGKTVLLNVVTEKLRSMGIIVLATATTGIAALNHRGGLTAHSMFKLPLNLSDESVSWGITTSSERAELIREAGLIILDEAPMAHKNLVRCLDSGLQDIMQKRVAFGGKILLLAGDFRQIPPVIPGASPSEIIASSLRSSAIWENFFVFKLVHSQRALHDVGFAVFIRQLGDGKLAKVCGSDGVGLIKLRGISFETSVDNLISFVFPANVLQDPSECSCRAILSGTNACISEINKKVLDVLPGNVDHLYSADSSAMTNNMDPAQQLGPEVLNMVTQAGVPDHDLLLKVNAVVILIRNLSFSEGLVNGTKLIVTKVTKLLIEVEKPYSNIKHLIPRICFKFSVGRHGIDMYRRQFPLKLAYALTINKSQGQTLSRVGVDLRNDVFSHGQLYVALGRARCSSAVKVLVPPERIINNEAYTVNIVYGDLVN